MRQPMSEHDARSKMKSRVLIGKRVCLRPLQEDDLVHLRRWSEDAELRGLIGATSPMSHADCEKFFEKVYADADREWFIVVVKHDNHVIGQAGLLRMDRNWRATDVTVIIGERAEWGKGYGTETILLLLDHAFRHLDFHRVSIGVVGFNERALHFWEKTGFKREGIERDGYYYDGKYYDFVMMSMLEDEFAHLRRGNGDDDR